MPTRARMDGCSRNSGSTVVRTGTAGNPANARPKGRLPRPDDGPGVSRPGPATTRTRALRAARASSSPRNDKTSREMKWGRQRRSPTISPRQRGENVALRRRQGSHQRLPSSRAGVRYSARANANEFSPANRPGAKFRGRGMRPWWLAWTGGEMGGRQRYLQGRHGG